MAPTPPGEQTDNRFASVDEIEPGDTCWAYARHFWRRVRVVRTMQTQVEVTFRLDRCGSPRVQVVPFGCLRRHYPDSKYIVTVAPPPDGASDPGPASPPPTFDRFLSSAISDSVNGGAEPDCEADYLESEPSTRNS